MRPPEFEKEMKSIRRAAVADRIDRLATLGMALVAALLLVAPTIWMVHDLIGAAFGTHPH